MSYWVHLEDRAAVPYCSFGKEPEDDFEQKWGACQSPCYPAVNVEHHVEGGTYAVGGTDSAELNVTYNYGRVFGKAWESLGFQFEGAGDGTLGKMLGERRAADTVGQLAAMVALLGTEQDDDYWSATDGNAGFALSILLGWARQHPDAVWRVS